MTDKDIRDFGLANYSADIKDILKYYNNKITELIDTLDTDLVNNNIHRYINRTAQLIELQKQLSAYLNENVLRDGDNIV